MPHDRFGRLLEDGDLVYVPCRVESVQTHLDLCNLTLSTLEPMPGSGLKTTLTLNTRQVVLQKRSRDAEEGQA